MSSKRYCKGFGIVFLCPKAYPLFDPGAKEIFGGSEVALYHLARQVASKGAHKVSFVVADHGQADIRSMDNIDIIRSFSFKDGILRRMVRFYGACRKLKNVVYVHRALSPFSGLVSLMARALGARSVYMLASDRETGSLWSFPVFKLSDVIFCQDSAQYGHFQGRKNVFLLKSGLPRPDLFRSADRNKSGHTVLWVGRSIPSKGHDECFALAEKMPGTKFVMVSSGTRDNSYHRLVQEKAGNIRNMELVEYADHRLMEKYYDEAKILLSTSKAEGFPMSFLEAMSRGIPVVSLHVDPDHVLASTGAGYACGGDMNKAAGAVKTLISGGREYNAMSESAMRYVKENHDIVRVADSFLRMCEEALCAA